MTLSCPARTYPPYAPKCYGTLALAPHTEALYSPTPQSISHPKDPSLPTLNLSPLTTSNQ
ncbi:hypothetical protein Hanom_Chr12g01081701 [Helianthus anomalus]